MPQYIEATCKIYVYRFPFDTQFCTLSMSSNQMDSDQFIFTPIPIDFSPDIFMGNTEWVLENATIHNHVVNKVGVWGTKGYKYKYVFQLKRLPTYYVTIIVIPTFLITAVSIVGIFSPGESDHQPGDVANLGLASLLALMVLLGIISDKLPKSDETSLLGFHILMILIAFCLCILIEMASLYQFDKLIREEKRPPMWLHRLSNYDEWLFKKPPSKEREDVLSSRLSHRSSVSTDHLETGNIHKSKANGFGVSLNRNKSNEFDLAAQHLPKKKNLVKKFLNNEKNYFNRWHHIIGEYKIKQDEKKHEIKREWEYIEAQLDFIWIFIFELFNVSNLLSLFWFASMDTPKMDEWLKL